MEDKDKKIDKLQAVIITLCTVIVGLASYIFYISNTADDSTGNRCEYNGWAYTDGESFSASDGCNTCTCSNGDIVCTEMACVDTPTTCDVGEVCTD